jgi:hypothetical protein
MADLSRIQGRCLRRPVIGCQYSYSAPRGRRKTSPPGLAHTRDTRALEALLATPGIGRQHSYSLPRGRRKHLPSRPRTHQGYTRFGGVACDARYRTPALLFLTPREAQAPPLQPRTHQGYARSGGALLATPGIGRQHSYSLPRGRRKHLPSRPRTHQGYTRFAGALLATPREPQANPQLFAEVCRRMKSETDCPRICL